MMKLAFSALCAIGCLTALPAAAASQDAAPLSMTSAAEKPAQVGVIKIGDHYCPVAPENGISDKTRKILALVSTTCAMEASGLISHDEAQSVYEQALSTIQTALAEIQMDAPALASK